MPGNFPPFHLKSIVISDGWQVKSEAPQELLSNHFYFDKHLGATSCHASYLGAHPCMESPVEVERKCDVI
jgi:hypothetical protein